MALLSGVRPGWLELLVVCLVAGVLSVVCSIPGRAAITSTACSELPTLPDEYSIKPRRRNSIIISPAGRRC